MHYRAAVLTLALAAFSIALPAQQRDNFSLGPGSRPGMQPSAQDMFSSLSGSVVSMDNKPLKDVRVEMRDANGTVIGSTYTNAAGGFEFFSMPSGTYQVVAISGLEQSQQQVEVQRVPSMVALRLNVRSTPEDGNPTNSVSVAQYRIPEKAREELKKANEALRKSKADEAQKHLAKALEIYPRYADAVTLRAVLKMDSQDTQGALADVQQAISYDQNCAMAYLVMGAILNRGSKFDDAIRALERGEALSPNSWQAYFEMGKALVGKAQYERALRQLDRAQALVPKEYPPIHLVKAHALLALNNYTDAMTELRAYLEKAPQGPETAQAQKMLAQAQTFADKK